MFRTIVLLLLGALFVYLIVRIFSARKKPATATGFMEQDLSDLDIKSARRGDQISIAGGGADYGDLDFTVDRTARYDGPAGNVHEVSGKYHGRRVYLESSDEDETEVCLTLASDAMSLQDLGLTEGDLARMDEEESRANSVTWQGQDWHFVLSGETWYYEDGDPEGEGFFAWTFQSPDQRRYITVTKWEGQPFDVNVSKVLDPDTVTVFRS